MAKTYKWQNVAVKMSRPGAWSVPKTLASVTKAAAGVATVTAHGYTEGTYVLLQVEEGMSELDGMVCRVKDPDTNTFTLEGIDTSLFTTFEPNKGTVHAVTFGVNLSTATSVSGGGGGFDFEDTTTIHKSVRTQIPGLPAAATYTFDSWWDPSDSALLQLKKANDAQEQCCFFMQFGTGTGTPIVLFRGYAAASLLPGGQAQKLVSTQVAITMDGYPNYIFAA